MKLLYFVTKRNYHGTYLHYFVTKLSFRMAEMISRMAELSFRMAEVISRMADAISGVRNGLGYGGKLLGGGKLVRVYSMFVGNHILKEEGESKIGGTLTKKG